MRTTIILIFWCMWMHRNDVVFNGALPSQMTIREKSKVGYDRWRQAKLCRHVVFFFPKLVDLRRVGFGGACHPLLVAET
jgi:hypothetical protein